MSITKNDCIGVLGVFMTNKKGALTFSKKAFSIVTNNITVK
jgi:hypothetical protein